MIELSVVVPLHNEVGNVTPLVEQICTALGPLQRPYEILLVNDGSTDGTGELIDVLAERNALVHPLHLDGNYGQASALSAGFAHAQGDFVLTLDGDLQNDPAELPRLLRLLEEGDYRVVSGWRKRRSEARDTYWGFLCRVLPSRAANYLIGAVTGLPSEDNGCSLKAYRREVVRDVQLPAGMHRFIPAVFGVRKAEFAQVEVSHRARHSGKSHYGLSRVVAVLRDLLTLPYLLRCGLRSAILAMTLLLIAAALIFLEAAFLLWRHPSPAGLWILGLCAGTGAYAECIRSNLERWQGAQRDGVYRIRGRSSGAVPGSPSDSKTSSRPLRNKLGA